MKKGFDFTLMVAGEWAKLPGGVTGATGWPGSVVGASDPTQLFHCLWAGESGLGKSTLVHSLFLTDLYKDRKLLSAEGEWTYHCHGTGSYPSKGALPGPAPLLSPDSMGLLFRVHTQVLWPKH